MANCSIPNSTPATGRISTPSLRRSKNLSKPTRFSVFLIRRWVAPSPFRRFAVSFLRRRVKGAWWPSRSSKPSSPCKWRGRFDSYPLRFFLEFLLPVSLSERRPPPTGHRLRRRLLKEGEFGVPAGDLVTGFGFNLFRGG